MNCTMGQLDASDFSLETPDTGLVAEDKGDEVPKDDNERTILEALASGRQKLADLVGTVDVWIGGTRVRTDPDTGIAIKTDVTPQAQSRMEKPGIVNWWTDLPNAVKYGVPIVGLFLILRR